MKQIPQDIDRTLWAIAESNDPRAVDEFGQRYPAYKADLVDRINLVRSLKSQRPAREAPYLRLPSRRAQPRIGRGFGLALAGAVMASLAFATVVALKNWSAPRVPLEKPALVNVEPAPNTDNSVVDKSDRRRSVFAPDARDETPAVTTTDPTPAAPIDNPVSVEHSQAKLSQVIREIGLQAKLKIELAPGMEDPVITARYLGVSARQALEDLGQNFGFTPVEQEENHVLIVPAIDTSRPPVTLPSGSYSEPSTKPSKRGPITEAPGEDKH